MQNAPLKSSDIIRKSVIRQKEFQHVSSDWQYRDGTAVNEDSTGCDVSQVT